MILYGDRLWRSYRLSDRVLGFIVFVVLVQSKRNRDRTSTIKYQSIGNMDAPQLNPSNDNRIPLKQAVGIFNRICQELRVQSGTTAIVCGSVRRECAKVGDIDILIITPENG